MPQVVLTLKIMKLVMIILISEKPLVLFNSKTLPVWSSKRVNKLLVKKKKKVIKGCQCVVYFCAVPGLKQLRLTCVGKGLFYVQFLIRQQENFQLMIFTWRTNLRWVFLLTPHLYREFNLFWIYKSLFFFLCLFLSFLYILNKNGFSSSTSY